MATTCSVFIAVSLDGFIARKDGSLDWLDEANLLAPKDEDCGYKTFMESIDVLVMGRNTFEKVLSFGVPWPYMEKHVVVLSSRKLTIPENIQHVVSQSSGTPESIVADLAARNLKQLYIDGGVTIQKFLAAGLIDSITLTVVPVLLGEGLPLFGALTKDISLKLVNTRAYDFGFVQLKYRIEKSTDALR
jgi:dihydrofolate reductase